jgi:hypothetical protein
MTRSRSPVSAAQVSDARIRLDLCCPVLLRAAVSVAPEGTLWRCAVIGSASWQSVLPRQSWVAADPCLTDAWDSLVKLAGSGAGWLAPPPAGAWAAGPEGLAGAGLDLVRVQARAPTGRLVVQGEPGAGNSMLMVRLVLDLLARRAAGGPVPILAPVGSWNSADEDLRSWRARDRAPGSR